MARSEPRERPCVMMQKNAALAKLIIASRAELMPIERAILESHNVAKELICGLKWLEMVC